MLAICDSNQIHVLNVRPDIHHMQSTEFLQFEWEVREIHYTKSVIQIELIPDTH